jgi:hypothetical protein
VWSNAPRLSERERDYVGLLCGELVDTESNFVERQRSFFATEPWIELEGLTPDQAITRLESLGW